MNKVKAKEREEGNKRADEGEVEGRMETDVWGCKSA